MARTCAERAARQGQLCQCFTLLHRYLTACQAQLHTTTAQLLISKIVSNCFFVHDSPLQNFVLRYMSAPQRSTFYAWKTAAQQARLRRVQAVKLRASAAAASSADLRSQSFRAWRMTALAEVRCRIAVKHRDTELLQRVLCRGLGSTQIKVSLHLYDDAALSCIYLHNAVL
jgi:hypothetical protein